MNGEATQARIPAHHRLPRPYSLSPCDCPEGNPDHWHVYDGEGLPVECFVSIHLAADTLDAIKAGVIVRDPKGGLE